MELEDVSFQFLREITDGFSEKQILGEWPFGVVYKVRFGHDWLLQTNIFTMSQAKIQYVVLGNNMELLRSGQQAYIKFIFESGYHQTTNKTVPKLSFLAYIIYDK